MENLFLSESNSSEEAFTRLTQIRIAAIRKKSDFLEIEI